MKKVIITRIYGEKETPGKAQIIDENGTVVYNFVTLELPNLGNKPTISCIPEDVYHCMQLPANKHFTYPYYWVKTCQVALKFAFIG